MPNVIDSYWKRHVLSTACIIAHMLHYYGSCVPFLNIIKTPSRITQEGVVNVHTKTILTF